MPTDAAFLLVRSGPVGDAAAIHRATAKKPETARRKFRPAEVAQAWGVGVDRVLAWIRSGELRAMNAAAKRGGRPRYLIDAGALRDFELRRAVTTTNPTRPITRQRDPEIIEFF